MEKVSALFVGEDKRTLGVFLAENDRVGGIVSNLLDNAARYAKTTVKLSCSDRAGFVTIAVSGGAS